MAKVVTANSVGTPAPRYVHPNGLEFSYPYSNRVVNVGTVAALENAFANAQPFDLIRIVAPGVYNITNTLAALATDVTLQGATGNALDTILRGPGMDNPAWGNAPHGFYSQYPRLSLLNLTVEQFYFHGLTFGAGAANPYCKNVIFRDLGQQFIKASQFPSAIDNGVLEDCQMYYTNGRPQTNHFDYDGETKVGFFYGGFIDVHASAGWIVRRCFSNGVTPTQAEIDAALAAEPGAQIHYWSPAMYFWNRSRDTLIEQCRFLNCARAINFGLVQRGGSPVEFDHQGGVIRNNMIAMTPGRLSAAQTADSDGMINVWDSPNTKILNNTILVRGGQIADAIQLRFVGTQGVELSGNLSDDSIRTRDNAGYSGVSNTLTAQPSWFVNADTADLHLSATGNGSAGTMARNANAQFAFDGESRNSTTNIGADQYG